MSRNTFQSLLVFSFWYITHVSHPYVATLHTYILISLFLIFTCNFVEQLYVNIQKYLHKSEKKPIKNICLEHSTVWK